jgi:hypothetical protein
VDKRTDLASAQITPTARLAVELVERPGSPALVAIVWPAAPTVARPAHFDQLAADVTRLLTNAGLQLAQIQRDREL